MYKSTVKHRRSHNSDYDLQADLIKIKNALAETSRDVRGRAGEIISQSFDDVRQKSAAVQTGVTKIVTKKPFKTIGIAVLFGAAVGYILNRNNH